LTDRQLSFYTLKELVDVLSDLQARLRVIAYYRHQSFSILSVVCTFYVCSMEARHLLESITDTQYWDRVD
jgi:hypothetical protein